MTSGWNVYYAVFLSAALGLGLPGLLIVLARALGRRTSGKVGTNEKNNHSILGTRLNVRFFLGANAALLLIALGLLLVPCALMMSSSAEGISARGLVTIVSVAFLAGVGLLYSSRKGDLEWLRTFEGRGPGGGRE